MGILRTDPVSGLGGANAIKGSVSFNNNAGDGINGFLKINLDSSNRSNFLFDGDFTIECWVFKSKSTVTNDYDGLLYISSDWRFKWQASNYIMKYDNGTDAQLLNYNTNEGFLDNNWHHLAIVRSSNTLTGYVDGTSYGTASESGDFDPGSNTELLIGYNSEGFGGFISNLRVVKGTAVYTGNFTPPTSELTAIDGTVLLCCQSPGNVLQEATGNYVVESVVSSTATLDSKPPSSSHFTPNSPVGFSTTTDVGTQFGSTFGGVTTFDSQAYMVPPGGNTRERNRGRAVIGWANNPVNTGMDVFNIQSMGNATGFGNLTTSNRWGSHAFSSTTRGLWTGGYLNSGPAFYNIIEFVTIATNGNPIDFGDTTSQNYRSGCCSSSTRGLIALGYAGPNFNIVNTIDQVTMATAGNATNFGDLSQTRANMSSTSSPTRGIFAGGVTPANQVTIDFVTIASAGDAQDFGDLQAAVDSSMALASTTRGIIGGGYPSPANTNIINFITIASAGNAQDFGDLTGLYSVGSAVSNKTRGVFCGGYTAPSKHNLMEFVTISTTGNASDFGDMTYARRDFGACSDSHGGLS